MQSEEFDGASCCVCGIILFLVGFCIVFPLTFYSRSVSMCELTDTPFYSEADFYEKEPYHVYIKSRVSGDCTLEFEEKEIYIEYNFSNKAMAQNVYNTFNTAFNTTTPTECLVNKYKMWEDYSIVIDQNLLDKMTC